jgi:hypothetical protein
MLNHFVSRVFESQTSSFIPPRLAVETSETLAGEAECSNRAPA